MFFVRDYKKKYLKEKITNNYRKYPFCKNKESEWIYKRNLKPFQRKTLNLVRSTLEWLIRKRDENKDVNKKILITMGLDPDKDISSLDAFYKKEFRKKKYIYFFERKPQRDLPEPRKAHFAFIPGTSQFYKKTSSAEFLKTFAKKPLPKEVK